jgi:hypothetical protein
MKCQTSRTKATVARRRPPNSLFGMPATILVRSRRGNGSWATNFVAAPHHVHKGQVEPGDADAGRGSSGIRDAGRLIYTLMPMSEEEARTFGIELDERAFYIRLDAAKLNIAARSGKATWFRIVGVPIGNSTAEYPNGDTVQVVEPWSPPDIWADVNYDVINKILNTIDAGTGDGNFYSSVAAAAADRAAWRVVLRFAPDKTEGQAREMIRAWRRSGVLEDFEYTNPKTRKDVKGLKTSAAKWRGTSAPMA